MKVEASVDIGNNLTSLLERLAQQIGTTADKVFPWYVQQAYLEGVTALVVLAIFLCILVPIFVVCAKKFNIEEFSIANIGAAVSGFALLLCLVIGGVEGADAVRKIVNPNYYAMQMLTRDVGRLAGR